MNNNAEYGYLRNHISATLLGSCKGLVARDYWPEPVLFLSFIFQFLSIFRMGNLVYCPVRLSKLNILYFPKLCILCGKLLSYINSQRCLHALFQTTSVLSLVRVPEIDGLKINHLERVVCLQENEKCLPCLDALLQEALV